MNYSQADIVKRYAPDVELRVSLPLPESGILGIIGPSGAGKSTLLRCLAGLDQPDSGQIQFRGQPWWMGSVSWSPQQRQIGFVTQEPALFPQLRVKQNLEFAVRDHEFLAQLLLALQLTPLLARWPHELSGGQKQRVALARALVAKPAMLLLDEPLSAIDLHDRQFIRGQLREWLGETPAIIVTHDHTETIELADTLAVMDHGQCLQVGPVSEVFDQPGSEVVAQMLGVETIRTGVVTANVDGMSHVRVGPVDVLTTILVQGDVLVCIRGDDVTLYLTDDPATGSAQNRFRGVVVKLQPDGSRVRVVVDCGWRLTAVVSRRAVAELSLAVGVGVTAVVKATAVHAIPWRG
jgi:molybdate transport system ATP-binding protein